MIQMIKTFFLTVSFMVSFSTIYASKEMMCSYLLHRYQEICKNDDDVKKIEELKILLIEVQAYYQGLPLTPDPAQHFCWMLVWGFAAQKCYNHSLLFVLCCLAMMCKGRRFVDDGSRYLHRDSIRERYARLESLIAGIKMRIHCHEAQVNF